MVVDYITCRSQVTIQFKASWLYLTEELLGLMQLDVWTEQMVITASWLFFVRMKTRIR